MNWRTEHNQGFPDIKEECESFAFALLFDVEKAKQRWYLLSQLSR